ncbi:MULTISPECIES: P-loop NTPase [Vibrio harveyi group]|uniref:P-loop NTPase n=1 Tax=Vibrio harveyi group TaxID=717610 RepID=UPI001123D94D|nr:SIR2 family protein [Vibrio parahaemolyticus]TOQ70791.1 hypothetical protein CGG89_12305 [Vibrio parahaemolyticus]
MAGLVELGLSESERYQLIKGVFEGQYNLLLGAGSSYGCVGGDGIELKDGATTASQIDSDLKLEMAESEKRNLPLVYEEALSSDENKLHNWLKGRFTNCNSSWQKELYGFNWQRIWTFNIDDVLEHAFNESLTSKINLCEGIKSFNWKDNILPVEHSPNLQQIIYLHGRASEIGRNKQGVIFSVPEYATAARSFLQWHASFQTHYLEKPFIVCGASLDEEVDLAEAIRNKNESIANGFPSLLVSFSLNESQKKRMRRYNLIPIELPLDEFFKVLATEVADYKKSLDAIISSLQPGTYQRFVSQFRLLEQEDLSTKAIEGTDFYGGDEPIWNDILTDLDSEFVTTKDAIKMFDSDNRQYAALIHGANVSGKTTSLYRIAKHVLTKGYNPYFFTHENGLNVDAVLDFITKDQRAVLFIDNASSFLEPIGRILKSAKSMNSSARFFISLRTSKLKGFRIDIPNEFQFEFKLNPMKSQDVVRFVQKRRRVSRLGKHIGKSDSKVIKDIKRIYKSDLLDSLCYVEFSEPLRDRVRRLLSMSNLNKDQKGLLARVVCVHQFGFSLPLRAALFSSGLDFGEFDNLLRNGLSTEGILVRDQRGIRLRHRILSECAWLDSFSYQERYKAMTEVLNILGPLINPSVISSKGIEHLIVREIVDEKNVSKSIGNDALRFYEEQEKILGWSSRYWDQRALLESKIPGHFSKAYSYSQKALSLEKHPFAYTSLGTICMRHSINLINTDSEESMKWFYEGEEALTQAFTLSHESMQSPYEHPFVTFFATVQTLLNKIHTNVVEYRSVLSLFSIWLDRAEKSPVFYGEYGQNRLAKIKSGYIKASLITQEL